MKETLMLGKLLDYFRKQSKKINVVEVDMRTGKETLVSETYGGKLWLKIATNVCPDCGHEGFYEGPSGGLSTNIFCANSTCGQGFNVTPIIGTAERIGSKRLQ